jgi:phage shock protein C
MDKKLTRKRENALIGGVCAGLGDYLGLDPLWIRLFLTIWAVTGGASILVYLVLWVVMPLEGDTQPMDLNLRFKQIGEDIQQVTRKPNAQLVTYFGAGLIGMGIWYLLREFGYEWWARIPWGLAGPVALVLAGIFLLARTLIRK